ncbi:hypothetical protein [Brooklawnia sp.]|uniref:hypothetical protein n=1 Tax=Brooklawnia sp. TaxID=2699740 RepID=UPI00311DFDFA
MDENGLPRPFQSETLTQAAMITGTKRNRPRITTIGETKSHPAAVWSRLRRRGGRVAVPVATAQAPIAA